MDGRRFSGREDALAGLLSRSSLFGVLSRGEVEEVAGWLPVKGVGRGQHVYTPASGGGTLYLLLVGRVRAYGVERGREITLSVVAGGEVFGESAFAGRHGSYAQALEPSRVAVIGREALRRLVSRNPAVGMRAVELLSERMARYEQRLAYVGLKAVRPRLASLLLELARTEGVQTEAGRKIPTRYSHEQLGAMIGARRVAVTRALTELRRSGTLEVRDRRIYVKDVEALEQAAA